MELQCRTSWHLNHCTKRGCLSTVATREKITLDPNEAHTRASSTRIRDLPAEDGTDKPQKKTWWEQRKAF